MDYFQQMRADFDHAAYAATFGDEQDPDSAKFLELVEQARTAILEDADVPPPILRALFPGLPYGEDESPAA